MDKRPRRMPHAHPHDEGDLYTREEVQKAVDEAYAQGLADGKAPHFWWAPLLRAALSFAAIFGPVLLATDVLGFVTAPVSEDEPLLSFLLTVGPFSFAAFGIVQAAWAFGRYDQS